MSSKYNQIFWKIYLSDLIQRWSFAIFTWFRTNLL